jgi:hypothetical protein
VPNTFRQYFDRPGASLLCKFRSPKAIHQRPFLQSYLKKRECSSSTELLLQIAYIAPAVRQQPEHGCGCGRRAAPELADCLRALRVVRNSLLGPNGVSEWVWRAGASRETIGAGSRSRCPRRVAGDLLGGGCSRLDDHGRDHALQGLAAVNEDMAMAVMPLRACWHS